MNFYKGKTIWITGASSGIGEALTYALAKQGAKIIASARRVEELKRVQAQAASANIHVLPLDLEATSTFEAAVAEAIKVFGHIDIMVHNGGISHRGLAKDTLPQVQRRVMEIDYFSYMELTRLLYLTSWRRKAGTL